MQRLEVRVLGLITLSLVFGFLFLGQFSSLVFSQTDSCPNSPCPNPNVNNPDCCYDGSHKPLKTAYLNIKILVKDLSPAIDKIEVEKDVERANEIWKYAGIEFIIKGRISLIQEDGLWDIQGADQEAIGFRLDNLFAKNKDNACIHIYYVNLISLGKKIGRGVTADSSDPTPRGYTGIAISGYKPKEYYKGPYTLAHELGHMLLCSDEHESYYSCNLMRNSQEPDPPDPQKIRPPYVDATCLNEDQIRRARTYEKLQDVICVDDDHPSPLHPDCANRTGTSDDPYCTIQEAIDAANTGETVLVADGTYGENINFNGKTITVISQKGSKTTIIDGSQNGSVVTFNSGEDKNSVLEGFTIQNGSADSGGGIFCGYSSSPSIICCTISGNSANGAYPYGGGGIFCEFNSSTNIIDCIITSNLAACAGGGIYCSSSNIINCTISKNSVTGNMPYPYGGGGIFCKHSSGSPIINNCTISENSTIYNGGGIFSFSFSLSIENCTIAGNSAGLYGGGVYCDSSPNITNCTISRNSGHFGGGGIFCHYGSSPSISNCTITGNSASYGGGVCCDRNSSPNITNCIYWNNAPNEIINNGTLIITYSDIQGGYTGEGNINANPLFIDPNGGNYRLYPLSHCIDAGDPNSAINEDKDGNPRPQDGDFNGIARHDIGAYEYFSTLQVIISKTVTIFQNTFQSFDVFIYPSIFRAIFNASIEGSDIDLVLIKPDGTEINPSVAAIDPNITFTSRDNSKTYNIISPVSGEWQMVVTGTDVALNGELINVSVKAVTDISLPLDFEINLPIGWSMISLPVKPQNCTVSSVFPKAEVVYSYEKGAGYVRVPNNKDLEVGKGYWILSYEDQNSVLTGQSIPSYADKVSEDGWSMIGGCSSDAKISTNGCKIGVIYKYVLGSGYQRVLVSESLKAGLGYWILFKDVESQCQFMAEETGG